MIVCTYDGYLTALHHHHPLDERQDERTTLRRSLKSLQRRSIRSMID